VFLNALDKELRVTNSCELISKPFWRHTSLTS
jgi:hypothetical protein